MKVYGHTKEGSPPEEWQDLSDHLRQVAEIAARFADEFHSQDWAATAGKIHDIGKADPRFQNYLLTENGIDPSEFDCSETGRVNHSSAGAAYADEVYNREGRLFGRILAYLIAGHHAGLPDWHTHPTGNAALSVRMEEGKRNLDQIRDRLTLAEPLPSELGLSSYVKPDNIHLWMRMLFSCLVDADFLDTERFLDSAKFAARTQFSDLDNLKQKLDRHLSELAKTAPDTEVNDIRRSILDKCRTASNHSPGLFTLNVPTGGGKTLSSMAFALDHAIRHGKKRVIYVIPYTTIIDQTANEFRKIFGTDQIVEHHSNLDPDTLTLTAKLASENWDAPVVLTTNVQFFESLFACKPSRCRKLHNLVGSVIVLDEAQQIPAHLMAPCVHALNELSSPHFGASIVLCTATQPKLTGLNPCQAIIDNPVELSRKLQRTKIHLPAEAAKTSSWKEISESLVEHEQVLCIVNSRRDCHDLFRLMPKGTIYLSALMCGAHRAKCVQGIRDGLKSTKPLRVIATQLVEAGVDIDFPVVYRAMAGLDSIAQAAGRCNREGGLNSIGQLGQVHVFTPPEPPHAGILRKGYDKTIELMACGEIDPSHPESHSKYFSLLCHSVNDSGQHFLDKLVPDDTTKTFAISFRTVGQSFRLIDDQYRPVFVHHGEGSDHIKELKTSGPYRDLLRKLQRYTVNIPSWAIPRLIGQSDIEETEDGYLIWEGYYSEITGLDYFGDGPEIEDLLS